MSIIVGGSPVCAEPSDEAGRPSPFPSASVEVDVDVEVDTAAPAAITSRSSPSTQNSVPSDFSTHISFVCTRFAKKSVIPFAASANQDAMLAKSRPRKLLSKYDEVEVACSELMAVELALVISDVVALVVAMGPKSRSVNAVMRRSTNPGVVVAVELAAELVASSASVSALKLIPGWRSINISIRLSSSPACPELVEGYGS